MSKINRLGRIGIAGYFVGGALFVGGVARGFIVNETSQLEREYSSEIEQLSQSADVQRYFSLQESLVNERESNRDGLAQNLILGGLTLCVPSSLITVASLKKK